MKRLTRKTYLKTIKNSVDCNVFKNFFIEEDDKEIDAMQNGKLSCAFFVSGILTMFGLIESIHGTIKGTILDLEKSGWIRVDEPSPGDILIWEAKDCGTNAGHRHIGFYIGDNLAISNDYEKGTPIKHNWTYGDYGKIETIYTQAVS
ncbi:MAG: hypothetical protein WC536_01205 [Patescibacteria group bacterium]